MPYSNNSNTFYSHKGNTSITYFQMLFYQSIHSSKIIVLQIIFLTFNGLWVDYSYGSVYFSDMKC